jgi:hypothetical protein
LQRHVGLEQNARLFALLNIGLADAAINCWEAKYLYNLWRPVTAINDPRASQINPATTSDPSWGPLWKTPNFPSYTSGHSTFSGTADAILTAIFGSDTAFAIGSDDMPGYSRSFTSFAQAADEAGESRIFGGIHFVFDNHAGLQAGRALGGYIVPNFLLPLEHSSDARLTTGPIHVRPGRNILPIAPLGSADCGAARGERAARPQDDGALSVPVSDTAATEIINWLPTESGRTAKPRTMQAARLLEVESTDDSL